MLFQANKKVTTFVYIYIYIFYICQETNKKFQKFMLLKCILYTSKRGREGGGVNVKVKQGPQSFFLANNSLKPSIKIWILEQKTTKTAFLQPFFLFTFIFSPKKVNPVCYSISWDLLLHSRNRAFWKFFFFALLWSYYDHCLRGIQKRRERGGGGGGSEVIQRNHWKDRLKVTTLLGRTDRRTNIHHWWTNRRTHTHT